MFRRKMIKKIIYLGVILVMCLGIFSGCNSGLWFKVGYAGEGGFGSKESDEGETFDVLALVSSLQEMKDLCDEWNNPAYQEESEFYSSEISQKIREYDEAFFEEKALIICAGLSAKPSDRFKVSNIIVDEEQLIINIRKIHGNGEDLGTTYMLLIEVKKADIVGIEKVQIVEK